LDQAEIITVMQDAVTTILTVAAPIMIVAMVVGVVISIFQATTQINEQTLAFVPKIVAILLVILVFGGMMLSNMTEFSARMFGYATTMLQ
jgi:flagellar biosynthetic protein FliQ